MTRLRSCAALWLACGLLVVVGLASSWANEPPTTADLFVTAVRDTPQAFRIVATDMDIDPMAPDAHPIRFILIDGPRHGALSGDLEAVGYGPLNEAWVELTYVPASGYVGRDALTVIALDPLDAESRLATVDIEVVEGRGEGAFAGSWDSEFAFNVPASEATAFTQRLTEVYRVGGMTVKGVAEFAMESPGGVQTTVFDALRFVTDVAIGDLDVSATLAFDPEGDGLADLFDYFQTSMQTRVLGASVSHSLYLAQPQTASYQILSLQATVGGISFADSVRFGVGDGCGLLFARNDAHATWSWCEAQFRAVASFTSSGFEDLTFRVSGIRVPQLGLIPSGITLDATLTFAVEAKSVAVSFNWNPIRSACIYVLGELAVGGEMDAEVQGALLYGLVLECEIAEGVRLKSATSFAAEKNAVLTGQIDYFEALTLSGVLAPCCGVPGNWGVATYFRHDSTRLFDWGMTVLKADVPISEHLDIRLDIAVRSGELGDPRAEFTVGWTARW